MLEETENDISGKFGEAEKLLRETKSIFDNGDYVATIDKATEAIEVGAKALAAFYEKGLSFAIRSSESMISNLQGMDIDSSSLKEILEDAKKSYAEKEFDSAGNIVVRLKEAVSELAKEHSNKISELIEIIQSLIEEARGMGAQVTDAEQKLEEARKNFNAESLAASLDCVTEAETLVRSAKENRIKDISEMITRADKLIEDARFLHAPVSEAEEYLEAARGAFDSEDYSSAIENIDSAISSANAARDEQIQRALSLQEKMKGEVSQTAELEVVNETEPTETFEELPEEVEEKVEPKEEVEIEEGIKVCPKCGGEPNYVEQYKRYYCYTCSEYVEPEMKKVEEPEMKKVEEKPEPVAEAKIEEGVKVCPNCGGEPNYVEQYKRYYCYTCSEYVEPEVKKVEERKTESVAEGKIEEGGKVCPKCGGEPNYVEQYKKYYCYTCSEYVVPVEKKEEKKTEPEKSKAEAQGKVCPTCGGEPNYVEQYKKYYCYTCSEYVVPVEKKEEKKTEPEKPKAEAQGKVCPNCGGEPNYVEQYKKYYCYTCSEYVVPTGKKSSEHACPSCGKEATYVEQYKRYYCYACSNYV